MTTQEQECGERIQEIFQAKKLLGKRVARPSHRFKNVKLNKFYEKHEKQLRELVKISKNLAYDEVAAKFFGRLDGYHLHIIANASRADVRWLCNLESVSTPFDIYVMEYKNNQLMEVYTVFKSCDCNFSISAEQLAGWPGIYQDIHVAGNVILDALEEFEWSGQYA